MTPPRHRHGQSLVELAIVLPVFILVIFGLAVLIQQVLTTNATVAAARVAVAQAATSGSFAPMQDGITYSLGTTDAAGHPVASGPVADIARVSLGGAGVISDLSAATITVRCQSTPCRRYQKLAVRITYASDSWVGLPFLDHINADESAVRANEVDQQVAP